jgi:hypothetical protein
MRQLLCKLSRLLWPFFWFHEIETVETYDSQTRKLRCVICGDYFGMSDRHEAVLPWADDFEKLTCDIYGLPRTKR